MLRIRDRIRRLEAQRPTPPKEGPRFTPAQLNLLQADPVVRQLEQRSGGIWHVAEDRYHRTDGRLKPSAGVAYRDAVLRATTDDELFALHEIVTELEARIEAVLRRPVNGGRR